MRLIRTAPPARGPYWHVRDNLLPTPRPYDIFLASLDVCELASTSASCPLALLSGLYSRVLRQLDKLRQRNPDSRLTRSDEMWHTIHTEGMRAIPKVPDWRGSYLAFFVIGGHVSGRLNLHIDETGNQTLSEGLYIIAVVLHRHTDDIVAPIDAYEERLALAGLDDVPFHGKDLLHGNEAYATMSVAERKRLLTQFARLVRSLPFEYFTLRYDDRETHSRTELEARIRRDLASLVFDYLDYFQSFDSIAVYYDDGQQAVSVALHDALEYVLASNVADYRDADHSARRLLQVADYICTVERAALAYGHGTPTNTQTRFFGRRRQFTQNFMKQLAKKRLK